MKKSLIYFIIICLIIIIIKFRFSDYEIEYKLDKYNIKTIYKDNRFYYEIKDKDKIYNFDIYDSRKLTYSKIDKIKRISKDDIVCLYPSIKDVKTYPLCYKKDEYIDYNLLDIDELEEYKEENVNVSKPEKDFVYYNNLNENEYIALWNYKGYIVMNNQSYQMKDIFKNDKYDNTLAYLLGNTIYMANNDEEHEYTSLIAFDLETLNTSKIDLGYNIDFDSYIVGNVKDNLYIFDIKASILYEINIKNNEVNIVGNNEKGFVKYQNGKFVNCSKTEYKVDRIKYNTYKSNYTYSNNKAMFKVINDNKNIKQKIYNDKYDIISERENNIYFLYKDYLYKYSPSFGSTKVFYNYELSFNRDNTIFVYNK